MTKTVFNCIDCELERFIVHEYRKKDGLLEMVKKRSLRLDSRPNVVGGGSTWK